MVNAVTIVGIILLILGLFYAAAPHDIHVSSGAGFGWDHTVHIVLGVILIIIGILAIYFSSKKKKGKK